MQYKSILSFLLVLGIGTSVAFAQDDDEDEKETLGYKILYDNPDYDFFRISLPIWELDMAAYNPSIYNLNVGLHFKRDNLMAKASYNLSLADRFISKASPQLSSIHVISINGNTRAYAINAELCYLIKSESVKKDITVKLKSSGKVDYVTKINATEKTSYGVRAGYKTGSSWYALPNKVEIMVEEPSGMPRLLNKNSSSTMMQYALARIGANRIKSTNIVAKIDKYGLRDHSFLNELYLDILIPLSVTFDDVYEQRFENNATKEDPGTPIERTQFSIEKSNIVKQPIGVELGFRMMPYNHWYGGYMGIGIFPGIKGNSNQYFMVGIQAFILGKFKYSENNKSQSI